jgi:hypothetical protein
MYWLVNSFVYKDMSFSASFFLTICRYIDKVLLGFFFYYYYYYYYYYFMNQLGIQFRLLGNSIFLFSV